MGIRQRVLKKLLSAEEKLHNMAYRMAYGSGEKFSKEKSDKILSGIFRGTPEREALLSRVVPVVDRLRGEPAVKSAWLFGSAASKKAKPSDADLVANLSRERGTPSWLSPSGETDVVRMGRVDVLPIRGGRESSKYNDIGALLNESMSRYGEGYKPIRILGLGALGVGGSQMADILGPSKAEAFPIGKMVKAGGKALGSLSSASERLAGKSVQGKIVKEVRKGHGTWRQIIFEDGDTLPVTKDYINALARSKGTDQYLSAFAEKGQEGRLQQALTSMARHESMVYPPRTTRVGRDVTENYHQAFKARAQKLQEIPPDSVMVQRGDKSYMMPKPYAEILERNGILKIIEKKAPTRKAPTRKAFDHFDHSGSVSPEKNLLDALFKGWDKGD